MPVLNAQRPHAHRHRVHCHAGSIAITLLACLMASCVTSRTETAHISSSAPPRTETEASTQGPTSADASSLRTRLLEIEKKLADLPDWREYLLATKNPTLSEAERADLRRQFLTEHSSEAQLLDEFSEVLLELLGPPFPEEWHQLGSTDLQSRDASVRARAAAQLYRPSSRVVRTPSAEEVAVLVTMLGDDSSLEEVELKSGKTLGGTTPGREARGALHHCLEDGGALKGLALSLLRETALHDYRHQRSTAIQLLAGERDALSFPLFIDEGFTHNGINADKAREALASIVGHDLGADREAWTSWWQSNRSLRSCEIVSGVTIGPSRIQGQRELEAERSAWVVARAVNDLAEAGMHRGASIGSITNYPTAIAIEVSQDVPIEVLRKSIATTAAAENAYREYKERRRKSSGIAGVVPQSDLVVYVWQGPERHVPITHEATGRIVILAIEDETRLKLDAHVNAVPIQSLRQLAERDDDTLLQRILQNRKDQGPLTL
jgi:hypothetical protein